MTLTDPFADAVAINGISISGANAGDFTETNDCGSVLGANTACAIQVVLTPEASGPRSAQLDVQDAAGDQTTVLHGTGSDFTLTIGPAPTVNAGTTATVPLALESSAGDDQSVTLACAASLPGVSCAVDPGVVQLAGTASETAQLEINTAAAAQSGSLPGIPGDGGPTPGAALLLGWLGGLGLLGLLAGKQRRWRPFVLTGLLTLATACGSQSGPAGRAPVKRTAGNTETVVVTATSSTGVTHTADATVNIQ